MSSAEGALAFAAIGFIVLYLLETVLVFHSGVEIHFHGTGGDGRERARALVGFSGLLFHSQLDGVIIGIGFEIDEHLGFLTALGVILHEVPEGTTTYSILMGAVGKKAALWMSVAVAVATPVGAVLSLVAIPGMSESAVGGLLAVAAGSFLYVGASDLLPETHGRYGIQNAACLLGGGGLIYVIGRMLHEGH
jgi:zinc and cadmium transporter